MSCESCRQALPGRTRPRCWLVLPDAVDDSPSKSRSRPCRPPGPRTPGDRGGCVGDRRRPGGRRQPRRLGSGAIAVPRCQCAGAGGRRGYGRDSTARPARPPLATAWRGCHAGLRRLPARAFRPLAVVAPCMATAGHCHRVRRSVRRSSRVSRRSAGHCGRAPVEGIRSALPGRAAAVIGGLPAAVAGRGRGGRARPAPALEGARRTGAVAAPDSRAGLVLHRHDAGRQQGLGRLAVVAIAGALLGALVVLPWLRWLTTHFVITTSRVVIRTGILARRGRDIPLSRVNDVTFSSTVFERLLHCGTLVVESAGERGQVTLTDVPQVEDVQRELYRLLEADDARRRG